MLFGGAMMLIVGLLAGEQKALTVSWRTGASLAYLIGAGSIGGFLAYAYALRHLPVSTVSTYAYINPVIAVLLGALVLGEPLTMRIGVAAGLVLAGVAIVRLPPGYLPRLNRTAPSARVAGSK
jgi:drug/metabolite transporter (DMT)-like permease